MFRRATNNAPAQPMGPTPIWHSFLPLLSTPVFYLLLHWLNHSFLKLAPISVWHLPDLLIQILFGYLLFSVSRRIGLFLATQFLLMTFIYIGHAVNIMTMGRPLAPEDIYCFHALFFILEGVHFWGLVAFLSASLILLFINLTVRRKHLLLTLSATITLSLVLFFFPTLFIQPLDKIYGYKNWNPSGNFQKRGGTVYLIQEGARYLDRAAHLPNNDDVRQALAYMRRQHDTRPETSQKNSDRTSMHPQPVNTAPAPTHSTITPREFKPRSVYLLVLESLWDGSLLKAANFTPHPLHPDFRKLWAEGGNSWAMSPVYAGRTSDPEFEILCGVPANLTTGVVFELGLKNKIPCLPEILKQQGYATIASHANIPTFWNRNKAYPRLGFERTIFKKEMQFDDMNNNFLHDTSFYHQTMAKIREEFPNQPVLAHMLTITGHWPFPINEKVRPPVITSESKLHDVTAYGNLIYYTSKAGAKISAANSAPALDV